MHMSKIAWSRELFYITQCTKGDTTAAAVDATIDVVSLAPWKSPATPIIKRPTMVVVKMISGEKQGREKNAPINPNSPKILPNTSTTRILTNKSGSAASARAAVEPATPTQRPQSKLHAPTVRPPQKRAKPKPKNH